MTGWQRRESGILSLIKPFTSAPVFRRRRARIPLAHRVDQRRIVGIADLTMRKHNARHPAKSNNLVFYIYTTQTLVFEKIAIWIEEQECLTAV